MILELWNVEPWELWVDPSHPSQAMQYMELIPESQRPVSGTQGARGRRRQLFTQLPVYDQDPMKCQSLASEEEVQSYIQTKHFYHKWMIHETTMLMLIILIVIPPPPPRCRFPPCCSLWSSTNRRCWESARWPYQERAGLWEKQPFRGRQKRPRTAATRRTLHLLPVPLTELMKARRLNMYVKKLESGVSNDQLLLIFTAALIKLCQDKKKRLPVQIFTGHLCCLKVLRSRTLLCITSKLRKLIQGLFITEQQP